MAESSYAPLPEDSRLPRGNPVQPTVTGEADVSAPVAEAALWCALREHGDTAARDALIARYLPYAKAQAAMLYARRTHDAFEFEEYHQFAVVGLMESLERYDPQQGAQFKTYVTPRIVGSMLNGLERLSEQQQQIGLRRRLAAERAASLASEPLSEGNPQKLLRELGEIGLGIALGILLEGTGMVVGQDEGLPDNAYSRTELRQLRHQIWHLVQHLTDRERDVIRLHYQQQKPFDEVAAELGVTKGRVSQLHQQALKRLQTLVARQARCDVAY
ncbi:sigma-70 family RNA polymerase sigma factor [Ralstonia pseudosolanacearum]|uniref:Sigma-70 family RNA polymerase sigma factor n=1 Tax=Ralstonia solanacearum TaxID=305 RepID=A0AA92IDS0_RALSL|nr:sigma-70 family RNA polymerase sigma factor [Ralstonia pseudosolanacearum]QCX49352.1 sigma-70 family RNA polymerase sigma factor [Ralstonia pseudosolanacearum]